MGEEKKSSSNKWLLAAFGAVACKDGQSDENVALKAQIETLTAQNDTLTVKNAIMLNAYAGEGEQSKENRERFSELVDGAAYCKMGERDGIFKGWIPKEIFFIERPDSRRVFEKNGMPAVEGLEMPVNKGAKVSVGASLEQSRASNEVVDEAKAKKFVEGFAKGFDGPSN